MWTPGDISGSQVLLDGDHLYASHINELRAAAQIAGGKNVLYYGVTGNGVTDDTVALQAVFNLGGNIYIPAGTYLVNDELNLVDNTYLHGAGRGITIIKVKNGTAWTHTGHGVINGYGIAGAGADNVMIASLTVNGNKNNCTGIYEGIVTYGANCTIFDCETYGAREVGINGTYIMAVPWSSSTDYNTPWGTFIIGCYSHDNLSDGLQGNALAVVDSFFYNNLGTGIRIAVASAIPKGKPYSMLISNCVAHNNGDVGILLEDQSGGVSGFFPVMISNCVSTCNSAGITTFLQGSSIMNCIIENNDNVGITTIGAEDTRIIGNTVKNNGQSPTVPGNAAGIYIFSTTNNLICTENNVFDDQDIPTQQFGIKYYSPSTHGVNNKIINNQVHNNGTYQIGETTPPVLSANWGTGWDIRNNGGYNPIGLSAISVGASPFTYTAGLSSEEVYITGGTVSDIKRTSTTIATASPCRVSLEPYQTVVVTYSSAPTMVKDIK